MGALKDIFGLLLVDGSPEVKAKTLRLMFRVIVLTHILWACGWLTGFGLPGFAFAGEVDDKVQAAIEPIRSELGKVSTEQQNQAEILRQIRADQIATRLRELHRIRCENTDHDSVERLMREIETSQREYRSLTGERYPLDGCVP